MGSSKKPEKIDSAKGAKPDPDGADDSPAWTQGLKQLYDSVVDEPLPDSFKDLLDAFDDPSEPEKDAGSGKPT